MVPILSLIVSLRYLQEDIGISLKMKLDSWRVHKVWQRGIFKGPNFLRILLFEGFWESLDFISKPTIPSGSSIGRWAWKWNHNPYIKGLSRKFECFSHKDISISLHLWFILHPYGHIPKGYGKSIQTFLSFLPISPLYQSYPSRVWSLRDDW